jgi:predicted dehydrogenase
VRPRVLLIGSDRMPVAYISRFCARWRRVATSPSAGWSTGSRPRQTSAPFSSGPRIPRRRSPLCQRSPPAGDLDTRTTEALDALVRREGITTVLVATEPLAHYGYAQWALSRSLNVLVDKPPTARTALTTDSGQARAMVGDFAGLVRAAADGCCHAAVLTQRRW